MQGRLEQWLAGRRRMIALAIVLASVSLRVVYFLQLNGTPLIQQHLWDQSDMHHFDAWGRQIAEGDWLSRGVRLPIHVWHKTVAELHIARYGPPIAPGLSKEDRDAAVLARAKELWEQWCGGGRFYQDPAYPYLVGLTYRILGPDVRWVFAWQLLLGVVNNLLLYWIARRCFGDLVGLLTAVLAVGYAPMLFYEMTLLRETLVNCAGLGVVALAIPLVATPAAIHPEQGRRPPTSDKPGSRKCRQSSAVNHATPTKSRRFIATENLPPFYAGLAAGAALTIKAHFILLVLGILIILLVTHRRFLRLGLTRGAVFCAAMVAAFSPVMIRNVLVDAPIFMTASGGAPVFVISNGADAEAVGFGLTHAARIMHESGGLFGRAAVATLQTHPDLASYLRLLGKRIRAILHWHELPNNENFYYYGLYAPILQWMPWRFLAVAPLAAVGLILAVRRNASVAVLYSLVLCNLMVVLTFFVFSRYRLPLIVAAIPLAGLTIERLIHWILIRKWAPAAATAVVWAIIAAYAARPADPNQPLIRYADCNVPYQFVLTPKIQAAQSNKDWRAMSDILIQSLHYTPPLVKAMGSSQPARTEDEASQARLFAKVHDVIGAALAESGDSAGATDHRKRAQELIEAARIQASDASSKR